MTIWMRHPLRFAIAHLFHGKQMQTGWLVEEPSYITDHDATVNNISIETCFTNYAKSNIPNDRYPELQNDIKAVTVGKKWHVRSSKEGTRASAEAGADLEEFEDEDVSDWDDQLAGQDFIDDEDDDDESDKEEAGAEKADDDGMLSPLLFFFSELTSHRGASGGSFKAQSQVVEGAQPGSRHR